MVLDHLAGSFLGAGEVKKAADYFARAIQSTPENAKYHFNYANVAFLFRHELHDAAHPNSDAMIDEAMKHFAEAARLQPLNAEYTRAFAETLTTSSRSRIGTRRWRPGSTFTRCLRRRILPWSTWRECN